MEINDWFQALVIILSVMLAIFLLLSIIILVRLVQMIRQIKRITDHAENAVEKAEDIAEFFKNTKTPIAILKIIANISDNLQKAKKKAKGKSKK